MPLEPGTRLGPYEISDRIGEGGMGEVYRARDTRLNRTVALKIIKGEFSGRFEREARAISSLNHPNICALYDVGASNGHPYLVMEFVEGRPLHGPLPVEEALEVGALIAAALDAAHRSGIVHRDLKPANVLRTRDGVKLLDFGIARQRELAPLKERSPSETITEQGAIVGTLNYMAPEQLEGKEADARSDIFAFGCVMYELLTGRRAFEGSSRASVIAAVMNGKPPQVSEAQPLATPALDRVVRKCLAKDPDHRWQSARDLEDELRWVLGAASAPNQAAPARSRAKLALAALAGFALALVPAFVAWNWRTHPIAVAPTRFQVYPPATHEFSASLATNPAPEMALSPNGRYLAFTATNPAGDSSLWLRSFDRPNPRPLADTSDASFPFWSPDSRSIAFFAQGKLRRVAIDSGTVRDICGDCDGYGGTWNEQDTILVALNSGSIHKLPASGGAPSPVLETNRGNGEGVYRFPSFFPGGRRFLAIRRSTNPALRGLYAASMDGSAAPRKVMDASHAAVIASPGWLIYLDAQTLMARRFDESRLEPVGDPEPLADQVGGATTSYASISTSSDGTLAFAGAMTFHAKPTWFDRDGKVLSAIEPVADYADFRLSPAGDRVALSRFDPRAGAHDIWWVDVARNALSRFTFDASLDASATWSPDGESLYFRSNRSGRVSLFRAPLGEPSKLETVVDWRQASIPEQAGAFNGVPCSVTPDGKSLIYTVGRRAFDIWIAPLDGNGAPRLYQTAPFNKIHASLSPDGKWLAYASDETGRYEVHVSSFPEPGPKVSVSTGGGWEPRWRGDGRELYFLAPERKLMAVTVEPGSPPRLGVPKALFTTRTRLTPHPYQRNFDVAPRGDRFLVNTLAEDAPRPAIEVVLHWQAALGRN